MNILKSLIKEVLLTERVFGAQAFVYHGSHAKPDKMLDMIVNDSLDPGKAAGAMYGNGLYTVYEEDFDSNTFTGEYGSYVYKFKVSLYGFVIFDAGICQKVYGKVLSPLQQLELLGMQGAIKHFKTQDLLLPLEKIHSKNEFSSATALKLKDMSKFVKGIVFVGQNDGKVALIYDPQTTVPAAWSRVGKNIRWKKWDRQSIKPALKRSAMDMFEPGRYNISGLEEFTKGRKNIKSDLFLTNSELTSLPDGLRVGGHLILFRSKISSLPNNLWVGGDLDINFTAVTSLPPGLFIGGNFSPWGSQITSLPDGLKIGGHLDLKDSQITSLSRGLEVGGNLVGRGAQITSLPDGLKVGGDLVLSGSSVTSLPADLHVGKFIFGFPGDKSKVPDHLRNKLR